MRAQYNAGTIYRFWEKVDTSAGPDGCWLWTAGKDADGYGQFYVVREPYPRNMPAHRIAYELTHGPIPTGLIVRHSCDNPSCVNPAHLLIGTHADNVADMIERGRRRFADPAQHWTRCEPERVRRGTGKRQAKVTEEQVRDMRQRHAAGARLVDLAADYGIASPTVHQIVNRRSWKHVT